MARNRDDGDYYPPAPKNAPPAQPGQPAPPPPPAPGAPPAAPNQPADPYANNPAVQAGRKINTNISDAQWAAWSKYYNPQTNTWTSSKVDMNGNPIQGNVEHPDACPEGMQAYGINQCRNASDIPGGGGGAGGGGGQGGGVPGAGNFGQFGDLLQSQLTQLLQSGGSRYSPEVMQRLQAAIKQRATASGQQQVNQATADAARRGLLRSGNQSARFDAIRRGAGAEVTGGLANLDQAKVNADYQDKMGALDRAQRYLDSSRDFMLRSDMNQAQKQQFSANLAFAYAGLQNQWDMLKANAGYNFLAGTS